MNVLNRNCERWRHRMAAILTGFALTMNSAHSQTQPMWTLESCIAEALRHSYQLQAVRSQEAAVAAGAREATANRWPTVGLGGNYAYTSEVQQLNLNLPLPPGTPPPQVKFGDGNVYDFTLNARIPIYAGGALEARARSEAAAREAARSDVATDSLSLIHEVRRVYFSVLGVEARAKASRQAVERLQRHLAELDGAQRIGTASRESRIMTEARLAQSEQAHLLTEAEVRSARLNLGRLIGRPHEEILTTGTLDIPKLNLDDFDSNAGRPDVQAMELRERRSKHLTQAARGSFLPALNGSAAYHYAKPGVDFVQNDWMNYYTLGLNLTWTLWDWRARDYRLQQMKASTRALEARKRELLDAIALQTAIARLNVTAAREALAKAELRVRFEQERTALVEGRYRLGAATEQEFLDAQDDLTTAETDLVAQRVRVRLAEVELLYALGR